MSEIKDSKSFIVLIGEQNQRIAELEAAISNLRSRSRNDEMRITELEAALREAINALDIHKAVNVGSPLQQHLLVTETRVATLAKLKSLLPPTVNKSQ